MPTYKSSDYKLTAVKYYLSHFKNQVHTCKILGCYSQEESGYSLTWDSFV